MSTKKNASPTPVGRHAAAQGAAAELNATDKRMWALVTYRAVFEKTVYNEHDEPDYLQAGGTYELETLFPHQIWDRDTTGRGDLFDAAYNDVVARFGNGAISQDPKVVRYKMLTVGEEKEVQHG